jgi:putative multiple sugar transport system permease protein
MFQDLRKILRENIREYGMYIALAAIWIIFAFTTDGLFLSSRNVSNLFNQVGYIAVLAVGMTVVIVIRHIDLSVGFLAGFLGAVAAIMMTQWGWPVYLVIPVVLGLGICAGLLTATPIAKLGVPSFVASLAGWLIYRGLIGVVTAGTGTIIITDKFYNAIGNGFIPDIPDFGIGYAGHKLTILIGIVGVILWSSMRADWMDEYRPMVVLTIQWLFRAAIFLAIAWVLAKGSSIVPVIGARKRTQLTESLGALRFQLSEDDIARIEKAIPAAAVAGTRYDERQMKMLDSERGKGS